MRRHWKQILLAAGSALGSMVIAALLQDKSEARGSAGSEPAGDQPIKRSPQEPAGRREAAINFLSDVLAETYRKVRSAESTKRQ